MLDGCHSILEFLLVESVIGIADMLHQKTKRDLFGDFNGALDLVHGVDASSPISGGDVDRRAAGASPIVIGVQGGVDRVQGNASGFEPVGNFADVLLAVGVVEMLARGKNLNQLGSRLDQLIEQARMEPFFYINVG